MRLTLHGKEDLGIEPIAAVASLRHDHRHIPTQRLPPNQEIVLPDVRGNAVEIATEIDPLRAQAVELLVLRSAQRDEYTRIVLLRERGYRSMPWNTVKRTASTVILDNTFSSVLPDVSPRLPEAAQLFLRTDESFKLRIFIDRSLVEVFVNGRQYLACRVYPGLADSTGVSLRSQGGEAILKSLDIWKMKGIYENTRN
jgi:beta-fructofuranosidase